MTLAMMENGQPLPSTQSVLQEPFLERMGRDLVTLCDTMEHHGLVDYQMGIWEEEIMNGVYPCFPFRQGPCRSFRTSVWSPLSRHATGAWQVRTVGA